MSRTKFIIRLLITVVMSVTAIIVKLNDHTGLFLLIGSLASIAAVELWDKTRQTKKSS